jgi:hypothetical protein
VKRLITGILILVVLLAGFVTIRIVLAEVSPFKGYEGPEQFVDIPQGSGPASIGRRLSDAGVIRDTLGFRYEIVRSGLGRHLQAGEYRFDRPMTVEEVVANGVSGWICRDVADIAARIESPGIAPAACRQWAAERFSVQRMVGDYLDIYHSVVSGVGRRAAEVKASSWTI